MTCQEVTHKSSANFLTLCVVGVVTWEIKEQVRRAQSSEPVPGISPSNRLHVATFMHSTLFTLLLF